MRLLSLGWSILFVSCLLAFFWSLQHLSHPCLSYIWHCLGGVAGLSVVAHPIVCECAPERNVMQSSMYMFLKGAHWIARLDLQADLALLSGCHTIFWHIIRFETPFAQRSAPLQYAEECCRALWYTCSPNGHLNVPPVRKVCVCCALAPIWQVVAEHHHQDVLWRPLKFSLSPQ